MFAKQNKNQVVKNEHWKHINTTYIYLHIYRIKIGSKFPFCYLFPMTTNIADIFSFYNTICADTLSSVFVQN